MTLDKYLIRTPRREAPKPRNVFGRALRLCNIMTISEQQVLEGIHDSAPDCLATPVDPLTFRELDRHARFVGWAQKARGQVPVLAKLAAIWGPVPGSGVPGRHRYQIHYYYPHRPVLMEYGFLGGTYIDVDSQTGKIVNFIFGCNVDVAKKSSTVAQEIARLPWVWDRKEPLMLHQYEKVQDFNDMSWEIKKMEDFQAIWEGHIWICQATAAVHLSRCFLALLTNMIDPRWDGCSPPSSLAEYAQRHPVPAAARQCHCVATAGSPPGGRPW